MEPPPLGWGRADAAAPAAGAVAGGQHLAVTVGQLLGQPGVVIAEAQRVAGLGRAAAGGQREGGGLAADVVLVGVAAPQRVRRLPAGCRRGAACELLLGEAAFRVRAVGGAVALLAVVAVLDIPAAAVAARAAHHRPVEALAVASNTACRYFETDVSVYACEAFLTVSAACSVP